MSGAIPLAPYMPPWLGHGQVYLDLYHENELDLPSSKIRLSQHKQYRVLKCNYSVYQHYNVRRDSVLNCKFKWINGS